jgi:hypothetical protein
MYRNSTDKANIDISAYLMKGRLERSKMATILMRSAIDGVAKFFGGLVAKASTKSDIGHGQAHC